MHDIIWNIWNFTGVGLGKEEGMARFMGRVKKAACRRGSGY